ncbi:hypothetical protein ISCGN_014639 [Ixodes scapularis]
MKWEIAPDTRGSDHFPIHITIKGCQGARKVLRTCTNWDVFRAALDLSQEEIPAAIIQALQMATRTTFVTEWLPKPDLTFLNLQAARTRAQRRYRRTREPEDKTNFNRVSAKLRRHAKVLVRNRWKLMCKNANAHSSMTKLWTVLGTMTGKSRSRHTLQVLALAANETPEAAAESLCALYAPAEAAGRPGVPNTASGPLDAQFTVQELQSALRRCRKKSAAGPDGVPYQALTNLTEEAQDALVKWFNAIWNSGDVPNEWKEAMVVPLLKAGKPPGKAESYRPVSLTSCISKLFERMVQARICWYLEEHHCLPNCMTGFRRGLAAQDSILDLTSDIEDNKNRRRNTIAVFLDVERAYDSVPLPTVLKRMTEIGLTDDVCLWVAGIYTTQIHRSIQAVTQAVDEFLAESGLSLSKSKTVWMPVRGNGRRFQPPGIVLAGENVTKVTKQRFLGIVITSRLRWAQAVKATSETCRPAMNAVRRMTGTAWGCTERTITAAHTALLTSRVMYRLPYMAPSRTDLERMEQRHRHGLRTALGISNAARNDAVLLEAGTESLARQAKGRRLHQLARLSMTHPGRWFLHRVQVRMKSLWSEAVEEFHNVTDPLPTRTDKARMAPWDVIKVSSDVRIKHLRSKKDRPGIAIRAAVEAHL